MTEQEIKDQEWFDKYGIKYHRNIKHGVCPHCGGTDVTMNDSCSDIDSMAHFQMICEDCNKTFQAVYSFSYAVTTK